MLKLLLCILVLSLVSAKLRYDKHQVFRLVPRTLIQIEALRDLENEPDGLNFWKEPRRLNDPVDIMVPPEKLREFYEKMRKLNFNIDIIIPDVQKLIDEGSSKVSRADYDWTNYYDIDGIYDWLNSLKQTYPGVVDTFVAGTTFEEREILGVILSYKQGNPKIFIESGIHAREWIAPAVSTWIINELLNSNDTDVRFIAENFDWYIVPSVNPDGYQYSHTSDRMWRKTLTPGDPCDGVDGNRNWDDHWNEGGASTNPCAETYCGTGPFSTVEAATLATTIAAINPTVYLCLHSYGQLLMLPYGHHYEPVNNYDELMVLATMGAASLSERYGTEYEVGSIIDILYQATGGSMDWAKSKLDVPYTFEWELRDTGSYGFILPPDQIIPTAEETFDSIITILRAIAERLR